MTPCNEPPATPPHLVRLPVNMHDWHDISFLHWAFEPRLIASLLPAGLRVLTCEGRAWVSVTPFRMRVRLPGARLQPPGFAFPETNVRTYVRSPEGKEGLWFLHMEAEAMWFVAVLRALGLPYRTCAMSIERTERRIVYRSQPRSGGHVGHVGHGGHAIVAEVGQRVPPSAESPRDRFLTARWGAYHRRGPLLLYTPVEHPRWPLYTATARECSVDGLFRAAGLVPPTGRPVVHFSPGVTVRVGRPRVTARGL